MDKILNNFELAIPMVQIIALLIISTFLVLFGNFKSALFTNFLFIFYWIYENNKSSLPSISANNLLTFAGGYTLMTSVILFGIVLLIFYEVFEKE